MTTRRPGLRGGVAAWRRRVRRGIRRRIQRGGRPEPAPARGEISLATSEAALLRARATLATQLVAGVSPPQALITSVRALARQRRYREAAALAHAAQDIEGLADAAHAALLALAATRGRFAAAKEQLQALPRHAALSLVPAEVVAVEFAYDPAKAVATCRGLLAATDDLPPDAWLGLARTTFGRGELTLCGRMIDRMNATAVRSRREVRKEARWLERWLERAHADRRPPSVPADRVSFAFAGLQASRLPPGLGQRR